jgi:hypothetical protein
VSTDPVVLVELIELRADVKRLAELVHELCRSRTPGADDWQLHENATDPVSVPDRAVDIANRVKRRQQLGFN